MTLEQQEAERKKTSARKAQEKKGAGNTGSRKEGKPQEKAIKPSFLNQGNPYSQLVEFRAWL